MKKGPDEDYKEYAVRWKNVTSMVRPPLTSREENSMFVDTLPFLYYDMLIVNAFVDFGDLMYSMGRIEDGIKREKIVDIEANMMEKRSSSNEHVQAMFKERGRKRISHMTRNEPIKNFPHSPSYVQVLLASNHSPQMFAQERDQSSDSSYPRSHKRKKTKVYHSLLMTYGELLPILIQNYGISVISARPRNPLYPRGYDVNAKCGYHRGVKGYSMENCTTFKDKVQALIDANLTKFKKLINGRQKH